MANFSRNITVFGSGASTLSTITKLLWRALATHYWRQARMPFNVTGQPGLVIPAGFTTSGLPLSLQLIGHPFGETMLYRVAQFYEEATGWTKRHPPALSD